MRTTISLILLVAVATFAAPAPVPAADEPAAQTDSSAQPAKAEPAKTDSAQTSKTAAGSGGKANKDGKICRTESVTNTRLKTKKVCLTPDEWFARQNTAYDAANEMTKSQLPEISR